MYIQQIPKKSVFVQIVLGLIANFTSLAPSMSLGFSAIALPWLLADQLDKDKASWVASVASVATPIGCLIAGPVSDRYGRKLILVGVNLVCGVGWIVIVIAYYAKEYQYPLLLFGRVVTGFSTGLASISAAVYMAEVSTPDLRGMFVTWNPLFFTVGVLMVYVLGWLMQDNWGLTAAITIVFPCIGLLGVLLYMVESPPWLVSKNYNEDAKKALQKLYNEQNCDDKICAEIERLNDVEKSRLSFKDFTRPTFTKPFILISVYFFFQQFSGVLVILFYAIDIVNEVKITIDPYLAICLMAFMRVVGAVSVSTLSRRFGRRPLSLVSGVGMTISMTAVAVYLMLLGETKVNLSWLPLTLLMAYFFVSTLGFLTMPFGMAAEVFPAKMRGFATGLTTCMAYIFNFIIVKLYPKMAQTMGTDKLFLFYGCVSLLGTIFVGVFLPETKNKTLEEIEQYFDKKKKTHTGCGT